MKQIRYILCLTSVSTMVFSPVLAGDKTAQKIEPSYFENWWNGRGITGDWMDVRDTLEDNGLALKGRYTGAFYGVVESQDGERGFFDQEISFGGEFNLGKFLKMDSLKGVKAFAETRWRDARGNSDPNEFVQASGMFSPSHFQSGTGWRLLTFGVEIGSANLLPVKDMVVLRAGWIRPQKEFLDQPLSKLFVNNAVESSKGIGGNIPFSSSFSTWGGTLRVKPTEWFYTKGGVFMAYPKGTESSNHGLAFGGYEEDPSLNGMMGMGEIGVTPKIGSERLPGKYAFGGYYWGNEKNSFNGTPHFGQYGFYWQADQMIYRESAAAASGEGMENHDGKLFKTLVEAHKTVLSDQGLSVFSLFSFAPEYNNLFPFYFHSGLGYKGLIPGRDKDQAVFAFSYGDYSQQYSNSKKADYNYTAVLEGGYRLQVNPWAFVQPFVQYIIRPNGSDNVKNAAILGAYFGVDF